MNFRYAVCVTFLLSTGYAYAQPAGTAPATIERVKITDNELSCAQIHAEIGDMEKAVADAKTVEDKEKTSATAAGAASTAAEVAGRSGRSATVLCAIGRTGGNSCEAGTGLQGTSHQPLSREGLQGFGPQRARQVAERR